jgi:signal transduction histidine kinase/ActR/RegA family two-component response regulator
VSTSDDEHEQTLLRSVALQNARSILVARQRAEQELLATKEALEEEKRVLELLARTGATLGAKLELEAVVQAVTDASTELSGAQFGAFFYTVTDERGDVFTLYTLSGAPREAFEKFGHPRSTPLFGPAFEGRGVIRSGNVKEDPRYGKWGPHWGMPPGHPPVCSFLAVPVFSRNGRTIGGLFFGHEKPDVFTERSERLVVGLAAQAGIMIDNARLYEAARDSAEAERAARAEVERVSLMKDEFLATLSHELRTPLNAVLGWAQMLLDRGGSDPDARHGLEVITRNAKAQAQIVEDLLDMNAIVSGKMRLDVQPLDLVAIVEAAIESAMPSVEARSLRLRKVVNPFAGLVCGDPHRIQQVLWNLLSNAVKFTPKGGRIEVLLSRVNSHVEITVSDTGIGIDPEFLPYVFDRFRQADASSTREQGGLGLGLAIVRQLVELHGGSVRAESAGEGRGSTFVLNLPVRAVRASAEPSGAHTRPSADPRIAAVRLSGLKVLAIDDEDDAREMLQFVLRDAGASVTTASSADEGLAVVQAERPDILVSDIGMPHKDGYQFMRDVRALPPSAGGKTLAIALTAFARPEDRTRALLAGYQVHVAKPVQPHELVLTIASLTGRIGGS